MAVYRHIQVSFWQDAFVLDLTPEEKYFYLYLMTNNKTSQCGIYELPLRVIEMDTGYNRETVEKLLKRFVEYGKILYCKEAKEIMILNWLKFNFVNSPKVRNCMSKELGEVKNKEFLKKLLEIVKEQKLTEDTAWIPYENPIDITSRPEENPISTLTEYPIDIISNTNEYHITNKSISKENPISLSSEYAIDTISIPYENPINTLSIDYGEKEKQKEKEKEKQKEKRERDKEKESLSVHVLKYFNDTTGLIGGLNFGAVKQAVEIHGESNVIKAIDRALEMNKPTMIYINGILRNWAKEGYPKKGEEMKSGSNFSSRGKNSTEYKGFKPQEPRQLSEKQRREIESELI
jgi:DnaD/phage-associated family protein